MNRKQFILLLVIVAILGSAGLVIHERGNHSWQSAEAGIGQKLLPGFPLNDIAQITISSGTNTLDLVKVNDRWRVRQRGDYPADFSRISDTLIKFGDLKIVQNEEIGPSQRGRLELALPGSAANAGTLVEFKGASGKPLDTLLLGKKHLKQSAGTEAGGWPDGRYVMVGTNAGTVAVISDPLDGLEPAPAPWLDKAFFSIEKPRSIAVQFPEDTNSWELTRASETNDWELAAAGKNEKLDSSKISSVTSPFSSPGFDDVAPALAIQLTNAIVMKVATFDGFNYVIQVGPKQNDDYPVKLAVTAQLPSLRVPVANEPAAEKNQRDADFKDQQTRLAAKLAREQKFGGWIYSMPAYGLDEILKPGRQLIVDTNGADIKPPVK